MFCGAGGASVGYWAAGFEVLGVDIAPQPNYPYDFVQADALEFAAEYVNEFSFVHASPPCQAFTAYRRKGHGVGDGALNLIPHTRDLLTAAEVPYVIENVEQAREHLIDPIRLCGSMFALDVQRHRLFESSMPLAQPQCDHAIWEPRFPPATNRANLRKTVEVGVWRIPLEVQQQAMGGIDWMNLKELSQAIPPAYTAFIGRQVARSIPTPAADR